MRMINSRCYLSTAAKHGLGAFNALVMPTATSPGYLPLPDAAPRQRPPWPDKVAPDQLRPCREAAHVIYYTDDLAAIREDMLHGFFAGWPRRPSARQHLAVLRGSYRSVVAIDDADERVVGFVNMLSDGVLTAFIPWLEVLSGYQGQGIGSELMRRILQGTQRFYSVDLVCDEALVPYYARFSMRSASSALLRHPAALEGCPPASP